MASLPDHTVYAAADEDLDIEEDDEVSEEDEEDLIEEDVDDEEDDSISSATAGEVTIAVAGVPTTTTTAATPATIHPSSIVPIPDLMIATNFGEKKPMPPVDESRKLFQRLWTDEDEIELLKGFLDYNTSRGPNSSSHHHDTTAFYDQVKNKLQLDFNKNQLVEKLRRLKKKYRNVMTKISSGKEYVFKTPHDQATFEISCKIWSGLVGGAGAGPSPGPAVVGVEGTGLYEEDGNTNPYSNSTPNFSFNLNDHNSNGFDPNSSEKKVPRSRKRSRGGVKIEEKSEPQVFVQQPEQAVVASIPNLVEETVKSCLSPLFKELLTNAVNGSYASRGFGGVNLNPMPLGFNGSLNYSGGDVADEKWRKQHISELEVYSKRLELVQDEIKLRLEELRSMGS